MVTLVIYFFILLRRRNVVCPLGIICVKCNETARFSATHKKYYRICPLLFVSSLDLLKGHVHHVRMVLHDSVYGLT